MTGILIRQPTWSILLQVSEGLLVGVVSHVVWPPARWKRVEHKLTPEQLHRTKPQSSSEYLRVDSVNPD